jgi:hypothetical protein
MTALLTALGSGMSAKKILEYLMRKSPELSPKISTALASGISAEKLLKFFSNSKNFERLKTSMEDAYPMETNANPLVQAENIRGQNLGTDMASGLQRATPSILGTVGTVGSSMALAHALPNLLKGSISERIEKNPETPPPSPINDTGIIPQPITSLQPEEKTITDIKAPQDVLWNSLLENSKKKINPEIDGFLKIARTMKTTGEITSKEDFDKLYSLFEQKKSEGMSLPKALKEASNEFDKQKTQTENKPISKNETVATPHGIGDVKEVRGDKAIVDVDGKLHKVSLDELEASPLPEKDLADLYDELKSGIEKATDEEMSRMVDYAGYDPTKNTLAFLPYTGGLYVYEDISPEDANLLRNVLNVRKTSGENFIGVWKKDSKSPIGSAMSALIKKLQEERGGKGKEYSHKFETVYKSHEPAILASKKKKTRKKNESTYHR